MPFRDLPKQRRSFRPTLRSTNLLRASVLMTSCSNAIDEATGTAQAARHHSDTPAVSIGPRGTVVDRMQFADALHDSQV
jgi:ABC-type Fe3+-citrate transport system substrate-binding protein